MDLATEDSDSKEIFVGTVDDCYNFEGGRCVVVLDYNHSSVFEVNDEIKLVTSENEIVFTKVMGIEMIRYKPDVIPDYNKIGIMIENTERKKQKFPNGTEVYLIQKDYEQENS